MQEILRKSLKRNNHAATVYDLNKIIKLILNKIINDFIKS